MTSQSLSPSDSKKLLPFCLQILFFRLVLYFTSNNNTHELYHNKEGATALLSEAVQPQRCFPRLLIPSHSSAYWGYEQKHPKSSKWQVSACLPVPIEDAKHTHRQNQKSRLCKRLLVLNTCLKSTGEVVHILWHMSNLFNFFPESN